MQDSQDGRIDPSAWDGADDTDPALVLTTSTRFDGVCLEAGPTRAVVLAPLVDGSIGIERIIDRDPRDLVS